MESKKIIEPLRNPEVKKFIDDHQHLFWCLPAPKSETVNDELLVETLLNYGTLEQVHDLFKVMELKEPPRFEGTSFSDRASSGKTGQDDMWESL